MATYHFVTLFVLIAACYADETFEFVPMINRVLNASPFVGKSVDSFGYAAPKLAYEAPVTYPPVRISPAYGEPPLVRSINGGFDYTMVDNIAQRTGGVLQPGSYEYISADNVPVSVKLFTN